MKRKPLNRRKIFATLLSDEGLISKKYKKTIKTNIQASWRCKLQSLD
jgi:hypothetical protein